MEKSNLEIRANIKFLTKLKWTSSQIIEALHQVYGNATPHKTTIFRWIKRFKEGREDLKDEPREGRPLTSTNEETVAEVQKLVEEDHRITIDAIATEVGISHGSAFSILNVHLGRSKLSAGWVPKTLRRNQLTQRAGLSINLSNKTEANEEDFVEQIVTGDDSWVYQCDPESKVSPK